MRTFQYGQKPPTDRLHTSPRVWFVHDHSPLTFKKRGNYAVQVKWKRISVWFVYKGEKRWKPVLYIGKRGRRYSITNTWQGEWDGVEILRLSELQVGATCSRYAAVRTVEYRKRLEMANFSVARVMPFNPFYKFPAEEEGEESGGEEVEVVDDDEPPFVYEISSRKRAIPIRFPNLSVQQVINCAPGPTGAVRPLKNLYPPFVFNYMEVEGVTLEKHYPVGASNGNAGWEARKRVYLYNKPLTIKPEDKGFIEAVISHCRRGGPVTGMVHCSLNFEDDFASREGYDFRINLDENQEEIRDLLLSESDKSSSDREKTSSSDREKTSSSDSEKKSSSDSEKKSSSGSEECSSDNEECSSDSEKIDSMPGHCVVIVGDGYTCRKRLRFRSSAFTKKRVIFLVQDSNKDDFGSFKNGLCVVFGSSLVAVYVPRLSPFY